MKWKFHARACEWFWRKITCIHTSYRASSYWKKLEFNRKCFSQWYLQNRTADSRFPVSVLFTVEAYFEYSKQPCVVDYEPALNKYSSCIDTIYGDSICLHYRRSPRRDKPTAWSPESYRLLDILKRVLPELLNNAQVSIVTHPSPQ